MFVTPGSRAGRKRTPTSVGFAHRTLLSANADYYVNNTIGSDSNPGSSGAPFATLQHAWDFLSQTLDGACVFTVTINLAASGVNYTLATDHDWLAVPIVNIRGAGSALTTIADFALSLTIDFTLTPNVNIDFVTLTSVNGNCCYNGAVGIVNVGLFGGDVKTVLTGAGGVHLAANAAAGGCALNFNNITMSGSGFAALSAEQCGLLFGFSATVVGNPTFSSAFACADLFATVQVNAVAGTAVGSRFRVEGNSLINIPSRGIDTTGALFPGTLTSIISGGGEYPGITSIGPGLVSALPTPGVVPVGGRALVTNSTLTIAAGLGNVVVGTTVGGTSTPVWNDGTNWRIG